MNKKGGYIIIDLQSATIVNDLAKALDSNKPVLVYNNGVANFYTLSYDSDNEVFILTGAKDSYSVASNGTITDTTKHLYEYIFSGDDVDDSDKTTFVRIITDKYFETLDDLIASGGFTCYGYFENSDYVSQPINSINITETNVEINELYDDEQNHSLSIATLDDFTRRIIF